jgi:ferritin-like metal-binding protein YciE
VAQGHIDLVVRDVLRKDEVAPVAAAFAEAVAALQKEPKTPQAAVPITKTTTIKDILIIRLRDAYALEGRALELAEYQAELLKDYPELRIRVQQHVEETRQQQAMIEQCLYRLGSSTSALKEAAIRLMGNLPAMAYAMADDEVLKNTITSYAFKHYEIASYKALIVMAEAADESEIARICQHILRQEESMADWLGRNIEEITRQYSARSAGSWFATR